MRKYDTGGGWWRGIFRLEYRAVSALSRRHSGYFQQCGRAVQLLRYGQDICGNPAELPRECGQRSEEQHEDGQPDEGRWLSHGRQGWSGHRDLEKALNHRRVIPGLEEQLPDGIIRESLGPALLDVAPDFLPHPMNPPSMIPSPLEAMRYSMMVTAAKMGMMLRPLFTSPLRMVAMMIPENVEVMHRVSTANLLKSPAVRVISENENWNPPEPEVAAPPFATVPRMPLRMMSSWPERAKRNGAASTAAMPMNRE